MALTLFIVGSIVAFLMVVAPIVGRINVNTEELYPDVRKLIWLLAIAFLIFNSKFLYTNRAIIQDSKQLEDGKKLNDVVRILYENNPNKINEGLELHRKMFTEKGFVSIDAENNILNIINRYSKYSKEENKVRIKDTLYKDNKIFIIFMINNPKGDSVVRLGIFTKGIGGYTDYKEYPLEEEGQMIDK